MQTTIDFSLDQSIAVVMKLKLLTLWWKARFYSMQALAVRSDDEGLPQLEIFECFVIDFLAMPTWPLSSSAGAGAVERVWKVNIACFAAKLMVTVGSSLASRVAEREPALSVAGESSPEAFERCSADPKLENAQRAAAVEMLVRSVDIAIEKRFVAFAGRCCRPSECLGRRS